MKTPREILLNRHGAAEPKLDAMRQRVLAELSVPQTTTQTQVTGIVASIFHACWRELILPSRRIWTGFATIWILILTINLVDREATSGDSSPASRSAVAVSWQTQQHWMTELLADRLLPPDVDRPRNDPTKPHTENVSIAAV